jgi:hypothetical protein
MSILNKNKKFFNLKFATQTYYLREKKNDKKKYYVKNVNVVCKFFIVYVFTTK